MKYEMGHDFYDSSASSEEAAAFFGLRPRFKNSLPSFAVFCMVPAFFRAAGGGLGFEADLVFRPSWMSTLSDCNTHLAEIESKYVINMMPM